MLPNGLAPALLLLLGLSFVPLTGACARYIRPSDAQSATTQYYHKSEAELAAMTPSQRVDEYADEQAYHKYDLLADHQYELIHKYIVQDGLKALPHMIEIINEYDPAKPSATSDRK